jgi:hypothetical protein
VVVFAHENFLQQLHGAIRGLDPMESLEQGILNCELNQFLMDDSGSPSLTRGSSSVLRLSSTLPSDDPDGSRAWQ